MFSPLLASKSIVPSGCTIVTPRLPVLYSVPFTSTEVIFLMKFAESSSVKFSAVTSFLSLYATGISSVESTNVFTKSAYTPFVSDTVIVYVPGSAFSYDIVPSSVVNPSPALAETLKSSGSPVSSYVVEPFPDVPFSAVTPPSNFIGIYAEGVFTV